MSELSIQLYPHEEKVNVLTHLPGVLMGVLALVLLLLKPSNSLEQSVAYIIYSISFIILFSASSIYHFTPSNKNKQLFKKIDHAAIYLFMGGCYTPFILINMQGTYKYQFLFLIWTLALGGMLYKFKSLYKTRGLSVVFYIVFGLLCFAVKADLLDHIPNHSFRALAWGGVFYIIGVFFYIIRKIPYHHGIWHLFVLLGAIFHFYAVYNA